MRIGSNTVPEPDRVTPLGGSKVKPVGMAARDGSSQMLRLAELLAAVSLATDLADDAPFESALGDALTALELARLAGLSGDDLTDVYYLAFLYHLGCTAAADSQARVGGGDDVSSRRWFSEADYVDRGQLLRLAATKVAREWGPVARAQAVAGLMTAPASFLADSFAAICEVGARLGERLGAGPRVTEALQHAYARWDGTIEAVRLGTNGDSAGVEAPGLPKLCDLMDELIRNQGKVWLCGACAKPRGITEDHLAAGVTIVGAAKVVEEITAGARTVAFA